MRQIEFTLGRTCNIHVENPCLVNPCHNNGQCIPELEPGEFTCICTSGYFGQFCESFLESKFIYIIFTIKKKTFYV